MDVYLVEGSIDDAMKSEPFTLGIFSSQGLARDAVLNLIGNARYTTTDNICYSVKEDKGSWFCYYSLYITRYVLDKANTKCMK